MTEKSWPQDESLGTPAIPGQTPVRQESTFPPAAGARAVPSRDEGSTKDAAKDEAADVAHQAAGAARNVAETAKTGASEVAAEVKTNARDLLTQAKSDLTDQAGTQQQKVAEGLRSVSTELQSMASASDQPGVATDLVRQAAERSSAVATWLDGRDPGSLLTEVKSFARQKPGTFLLLAAGAGILAGRLSRSLSAGAPDSAGPSPMSGTTPATRVPDTGVPISPPPAQLPAPGTTTAGFPDTSSLGTVGRHDLRASEPVVTDPLSPVDSLRDDPFDGGRR